MEREDQWLAKLKPGSNMPKESVGVGLESATLAFQSGRWLLIEVLSNTTEAFDRGDKFDDYRNLESLQEYVLVSQTRKRAECFRRNAGGQWVLYPYSEVDKIHLASVDFRCALACVAKPIAEVYEDVDFSVLDQ